MEVIWMGQRACRCIHSHKYRHWPNVRSMLVQRLRRWPNIALTLCDCLRFSGMWALWEGIGMCSGVVGQQTAVYHRCHPFMQSWCAPWEHTPRFLPQPVLTNQVWGGSDVNQMATRPGSLFGCRRELHKYTTRPWWGLPPGNHARPSWWDLL